MQQSVTPHGRLKDLRLGIQSCTFRQFTLQQAATAVAELGLSEIELCSRHLRIDASEEAQSSAEQILKQHGLSMSAFGVAVLGTDPERDQQVFDFAHKWNLEILNCHPEPKSLDRIEQLAQAQKIKVAIHNHGPKSLYPDAATLRAALKGRSKMLGVCLDTGHFLRVPGEDPIAIVREFSDRLYSIHLRDMDINDREYVLGQGSLDLSAFMKVLQEVEFTGPISIEYEEHPEDPRPAMRETLLRIEECLG